MLLLAKARLYVLLEEDEKEKMGTMDARTNCILKYRLGLPLRRTN